MSERPPFNDTYKIKWGEAQRCFEADTIDSYILTITPSSVLATNKYKKLPINCKGILWSICERSKLWIALKSTTDVASFTTPSPNTRL